MDTTIPIKMFKDTFHQSVGNLVPGPQEAYSLALYKKTYGSSSLGRARFLRQHGL